MPGPRYRYGLTLLDSKFLQLNQSAIVKIPTHTLLHLRKEQQPIDFCVVCLFPILRHGLSKLRNFCMFWLQMEMMTQFTSSEAELTAMKIPPPWRRRCISTTLPVTRGQSALWILPFIKATLVPEASQAKYVILRHVCLSVCLHCLFKSFRFFVEILWQLFCTRRLWSISFKDKESHYLPQNKKERNLCHEWRNFHSGFFPQRRSCNEYFQMIDLQILEYTPTGNKIVPPLTQQESVQIYPSLWWRL